MHTHTHTHSLVICLSTNAVDKSFVGDDSMAVDLQRKLFGLVPFQLTEFTVENSEEQFNHFGSDSLTCNDANRENQKSLKTSQKGEKCKKKKKRKLGWGKRADGNTDLTS